MDTAPHPGWFLNNDSQGGSVEAQVLAQDRAAVKLPFASGFCEAFPKISHVSGFLPPFLSCTSLPTSPLKP